VLLHRVLVEKRLKRVSSKLCFLEEMIHCVIAPCPCWKTLKEGLQ